MKRNPSRLGTRSLADELAELRGLNAIALRQRWRALYRTEAPVRIGQALLLQASAMRIQRLPRRVLPLRRLPALS